MTEPTVVPALDPDLDLSVEKVIRAPRGDVWNAWADPQVLQQWWIPAPMQLVIDHFDLRPGGGFRSRMTQDGAEWMPHMDAAFVLVEEQRRIIFTTALTSALRPVDAQPLGIVAEVVLEDHPEGTLYRGIARHGTPEVREQHLAMGFQEGWGAVTDQLAALVEGSAAGA